MMTILSDRQFEDYSAEEIMWFLELHLDNRADCPNGLALVAIEIEDAIERVKEKSKS